MTKQELLNELRNEMFVMLRSSATHGIGVFALTDIPKGTRNIFSKETGGWIQLSLEEAEQLPEHSRNFIETYYLFDEQQYYIPDHGCKVMDMANYLNHSHTPNIISIEDGKWFEALRDISQGEELFVNYEKIVDNIGAY